MLIWPFLGKNSYFSTFSFSNLKPICHLFTSKLGNLGCLGRLKVAKKVKNGPQNIVKVAKTPYFSTFLGLSPGSIGRFCSKVVQMCSFTRSSTSRDPFGRTFSVRLMAKNTALCAVARNEQIKWWKTMFAVLLWRCYYPIKHARSMIDQHRPLLVSFLRWLSLL